MNLVTVVQIHSPELVIGESSNGRTSDSGSGYWGSNPYSPTTLMLASNPVLRPLVTIAPLVAARSDKWLITSAEDVVRVASLVVAGCVCLRRLMVEETVVF